MDPRGLLVILFGSLLIFLGVSGRYRQALGVLEGHAPAPATGRST